MATRHNRTVSGASIGGKWITPVKRRAIYARDGFRCVYCRQPVEPGCHTAHGATLDHIVTRDHACACGVKPDNRPVNVVTACRGCNSSRANTPIHEFATPDAMRRIAVQTRKPVW